MKSKYNPFRTSPALFTICLGMSVAGFHMAQAATWDGAPDGGGSSADSNWSTATNWVGDVAPASGTITTTSATVTNASTTLSDVDTTGIIVGSGVSGTGIDAGTTVTALDSGLGTVELSLAATADGAAVNITFTPPTDTLVFDGSVGLANTNDFITRLGSISGDTAFTFPATAGAYVISDDGIVGAVTVGTDTANTDFVNVSSSANQELALDIQLAGGNKARNINLAAGAGILTLSGDIDFSNSWLFVSSTDTTGTVVLSGNNTGPGLGLHTSGTNNMRSMCRLNTNSIIALGSPTALGDPNVDANNLRGLRMNTGGTLTTLGGMDLTGENMVNSTISWNESTSYVGAGDLEVGGLIYTKNNGRAWSVDGGGEFIISGEGLFLTERTAAQLMILQPLNGNVITINGPVTDTFQSGGIETQVAGFGGQLTDGILRLQGNGKVNINGDNLATFNGETYLNSANLTLKLGNANALGTWEDVTSATEIITTASVYDTFTTLYDIDTTGITIGAEVTGAGIPAGTTVTAVDVDTVDISQAATADGTLVDLTFSTSVTTIAGRTNMNAGTLDLNGFAVRESFVNLASSHKFINSNTGTAAQVLTDIVGQGVLRVDGPGDIIFNNVYHPGGITRGTIKDGSGTLTLGGDVNNNRYGLTVNNGNVILAKTAGEAVNRFPLVMNNAASTVTLQNTGDQIGNQTDVNGLHLINLGTLNLNGFDEAIAALSTTNGTEPGGIVTNSDVGTTSTLTLLGAVGIDAIWPGTITDNLNLIKNGTNTQTLSGNSSYTGYTQISGGTLKVGHVNALGTSIIGGANASFTGTLDVNGFAITNSIEDKVISGGTITNTGAAVDLTGMGDFTATASRTFNVDGTGDITFGQVISVGYSIVKNGSNTLTLSGVNTYLGSTTVNAGTLALNGSSLSDSSSLVLNGGSVTVTGTETVNTLFDGATQKAAGTYTNADIAAITSGSITVLTGPASSDYITWTAIYSPADLTDTAGDNDNDGLTNQQEYAYGLSPVDGSSVNPILAQLDKGAGTFTYQRRATTGLTYTVLTSPDLGVWTPDLTAVQVPTTVGDNESVLVTLTGPLPSTKLFVRVKAD